MDSGESDSVEDAGRSSAQNPIAVPPDASMLDVSELRQEYTFLTREYESLRKEYDAALERCKALEQEGGAGQENLRSDAEVERIRLRQELREVMDRLGGTLREKKALEAALNKQRNLAEAAAEGYSVMKERYNTVVAKRNWVVEVYNAKKAEADALREERDKAICDLEDERKAHNGTRLRLYEVGRQLYEVGMQLLAESKQDKAETVGLRQLPGEQQALTIH